MGIAEAFVRNDEERERLQEAQRLAESFALTAPEHDREGSFPFEHFAALREAGFLRLTVPKRYGGAEISLYEMIQVLERLAAGDGSTALGLGWHIGQVLHLRESRLWEEELFAELCRDIVDQGVIINSLASEPVTGSPSRGGKPSTKVEPAEGGWKLTGRKTYSTLSPILERMIVKAWNAEREAVDEFLVRPGSGVTVVPTWNTLGMRSTGSHDVVFDGVYVPERYRLVPSEARVDDAGGWMLHIPAVYTGIAMAARDYALRFATAYRPNSIAGAIADLPHIRRTMGEIEAELRMSRQLLYATAERWDARPAERPGLKAQLGLAKYAATNAAIRVVDRAMRIVGGASLSKDAPLERYYRDVRAGLHNPPMDDVVLELLAAEAFGESKQPEP